MAHDPEMRDSWKVRERVEKRLAAGARERRSRAERKSLRRKGSRAKRRRNRRATARVVREFASTVADSVGEVIGAILEPRPLAPTATPRPSPGPSSRPLPPPGRLGGKSTPMPTPNPRPGPSPPPPPGHRRGDDSEQFAKALDELNLTRSVVSGTAEELRKRIPEGADTKDVRTFLHALHRYSEGGMDTVPVVPPGVERKLPELARKIPRVSGAGALIDLVANLAEGEGLGEAVEDTGQGVAGGLFGGWLGTAVAGPIVGLFGGEAYARFLADYDEYLARARYLERTDPDYLERADRAERTGFGFRCDHYEAMGFKPQDVEGCEE